ASFTVDTATAVEYPTGFDPDPSNASGAECVDTLSEGFGIVHILCHGRIDGFMVRSANYGEWPASYVLAPPQGNGQGSLTELAQNDRVSLYYSLACKSGAYDLDSTDGQATGRSLVESLISAEQCGAVGMVGNARWGWVYSSYLLQASFTRYLFNEAAGSPVEAMYYSWLEYPYYRDLIYGQNFFGDPGLKIYLEEPGDMDFEINALTDNCIIIHIINGNKTPVPQAEVILSANGVIVERGATDQSGDFIPAAELNPDSTYCVTAIKEGYTIAYDMFSVSMTLSTGDDGSLIPARFELNQNYPNPFNPTTTISYSLPEPSDVTFEIYNLLGQVIWDKKVPGQAEGIHSIIWDGTGKDGVDMPTGIYFYRACAGDAIQTRKMMLLR
ncbi:MAG: T9SS type A sorting domain-containing protein, partial [Candidatus Zixiibacteriota bacterium]